MKECTCKNCNWNWVIESKDNHPYLCHKCGFDNKLNKFDMKSLNDWKMENKVYTEEKNLNIIKRTFSENVDTSELVWHRDKKDRVVIVLSESDWMIQFDNELPKKLSLNEEIFISKNTFHRVIKGSNDLVVEIIETEFEADEYEVYEVLEEGKKKSKKDACYYKVKSRYDVWPSAYGSGALVKCRKVGAKNWGNSTDESFGDDIETTIDEKWSEKYKKSIDCNNPKGFSQKAHCQGRNKKNERIDEAKKTDFTKEKEEGLHGWFARQGEKGKSKGWVDCNTCKKDPETGRKKCKSCGRKEGEERAKYPACRPTPSACSSKGKKDSWGKKSNESFEISENYTIFVENNLTDMIKQKLNEMVEPIVQPKPTVVPQEPTKRPLREKIWEVNPVVVPQPKL